VAHLSVRGSAQQAEGTELKTQYYQKKGKKNALLKNSALSLL
jgi:hypothetical protein